MRATCGGKGHGRRRPDEDVFPLKLPWLIVMFFSSPRSILMELVIIGIVHDPINVRHWLGLVSAEGHMRR
jgi:hypothetical protein